MLLTKKQRKQFVEECVKEFIKKFPIEHKLICESVKQQRKLKIDKWGSDKDSATFRWTIRMPKRLFTIIDKKLENPRFLEEQWEIDWFKKTFPEYRVSDRV